MPKDIEISDVKVDGAPIDAATPEVEATDEVAEVAAPAELSLTETEREILIDEYYPLPDDFPSKEQVNDWDATYGRVRIRRMAPGEAYVVRAMTRGEFRKFLGVLKARFGNNEADAVEERMVQEEMAVELCLLYPAVLPSDIRGDRRPDGSIHKIGLAGTVSVLAADVNEISALTDGMIGPIEEV